MFVQGTSIASSDACGALGDMVSVSVDWLARAGAAPTNPSVTTSVTTAPMFLIRICNASSRVLVSTWRFCVACPKLSGWLVVPVENLCTVGQARKHWLSGADVNVLPLGGNCRRQKRQLDVW